MNKLEEFKEFAKTKPFLRDYVENSKYTWQDLFERYDIYGPDDELFKEDIISNLNKLPKSADKKIQAKYDEKQKNYTEMKKAGISFVTI